MADTWYVRIFIEFKAVCSIRFRMDPELWPVSSSGNIVPDPDPA